MVFHDIAPQAPTHLLIIPKEHLAKIEDTREDQQILLGKMFFTAKQQAEKFDLNKKGDRLGSTMGGMVDRLSFTFISIYWVAEQCAGPLDKNNHRCLSGCATSRDTRSVVYQLNEKRLKL